MELLPFKGHMIPGLKFKEYCVWVLNWSDTPNTFKRMTEIWILEYDGKKVCYLSPYESKSVFQKYHRFDEIIEADINISETNDGITIHVNTEEKETLLLNLKFKKSLKYYFINFFIQHGNKNKIGEKGKTETGAFYHNIPEKIISIAVDKAEFNGNSMKLINKLHLKLDLGDGQASKDPIINYCTHMLEK
ncbi:hypothetical protein CLV62_102108 [Dysgonomonas alginatilytica]|uniref:Uncharacterized protein n=1 Tax=Dysgonomonas alginatilytica TaxID=1605892 RepID=A0A2V3PSA4_9BACT|nr:hypothetical protein [Dysgonomonas alginatilytica]PXV68077.1 hypothetical protein CLV62_102108 [Dysgonomonas alginatilytica]